MISAIRNDESTSIAPGQSLTIIEEEDQATICLESHLVTLRIQNPCCSKDHRTSPAVQYFYSLLLLVMPRPAVADFVDSFFTRALFQPDDQLAASALATELAPDANISVRCLVLRFTHKAPMLMVDLSLLRSTELSSLLLNS